MHIYTNSFQMYNDFVPKLSKGSFCLYYGGPDILNYLDDRQGSKTRSVLNVKILISWYEIWEYFSPIFLSLTLIYQISFMLFKFIKTRTINSNHMNQGEKNHIKCRLYPDSHTPYGLMEDFKWCTVASLNFKTSSRVYNPDQFYEKELVCNL